MFTTSFLESGKTQKDFLYSKVVVSLALKGLKSNKWYLASQSAFLFSFKRVEIDDGVVAVSKLCICVQARANGQGSMCNQAIMLITDGAMEDFESVFEEFNWPERRVRTASWERFHIRNKLTLHHSLFQLITYYYYTINITIFVS